MREREKAVLLADGIGKSFGSRQVLKSAAVRVRPGVISALVGRNGAGKTTLFRIAVGRILADYGRVLYDGRYRRWPRLAVLSREGLMYVSQESGLTSLFTVAAHLDAFARAFDKGTAKVHEVVDDMRLADFLDRHPDTLSGGEKQRVSMALALLREPRCLLMDEPFAGVAPKDRPLIASGLDMLARRGCSILISGHDVEDLFAVSHDIVWMVAGTTHELGPPAVAREHPQFRREYLGPRMLGG